MLIVSSGDDLEVVSRPGVAFSHERMSGGRLPKASSIGVLPPFVQETFLAQQPSSMRSCVVTPAFKDHSEHLQRAGKCVS